MVPVKLAELCALWNMMLIASFICYLVGVLSFNVGSCIRLWPSMRAFMSQLYHQPPRDIT